MAPRLGSVPEPLTGPAQIGRHLLLGRDTSWSPTRRARGSLSADVFVP
jgi:hypothetical protein